jgi:hypothetical protein
MLAVAALHSFVFLALSGAIALLGWAGTTFASFLDDHSFSYQQCFCVLQQPLFYLTAVLVRL